MKLSKALKEKNRMAGEVAVLKALLAQQNVRPSTQKFDYDANDLLAQLRAKLDELVKVKTAIATANAAAYGKIFRLAELKGLSATLKALDTKNGVFKEGGGFHGTAYDVEYVAQLKKTEVDRLAAETDAEIQALQDALDEFNFKSSAVV
jgi:hypothetical protein